MTRALRALTAERDAKQAALDLARRKAGRLSIEVTTRRAWDRRDRRVDALVRQSEQELEVAEKEAAALEREVAALRQRVEDEVARARKMTQAEKQAELVARLEEEVQRAAVELATLRGDREDALVHGGDLYGLDHRIRLAVIEHEKLDARLAVIRGAMIPPKAPTPKQQKRAASARA